MQHADAPTHESVCARKHASAPRHGARAHALACTARTYYLLTCILTSSRPHGRTIKRARVDSLARVRAHSLAHRTHAPRARARARARTHARTHARTTRRSRLPTTNPPPRAPARARSHGRLPSRTRMQPAHGRGPGSPGRGPGAERPHEREAAGRRCKETPRTAPVRGRGPAGQVIAGPPAARRARGAGRGGRRSGAGSRTEYGALLVGRGGDEG
jgi:hypothetical protein